MKNLAQTSHDLTIAVKQLIEIHNMPNSEDRNADLANCIGRLQSIAKHIEDMVSKND